MTTGGNVPTDKAITDKSEVLQGTLDLLILKTLALEPMHGFGISQRIQQVSKEVFQVNQGSLYPALHRMERQGYIRAEWRESENNRRAKYYELTSKGKRQLAEETRNWETIVEAIGRVLKTT